MLQIINQYPQGQRSIVKEKIHHYFIQPYP